MKSLFFVGMLVAGTALAQRVPWTLETTSISSTGAGDPTFMFVPNTTLNGVQLIVGTDKLQLGVYFWVPGAFPQIVGPGQVNGADSRGSLLVATNAGGSLLAFDVSDAGVVTQLDTGMFTVPSPKYVALAKNRDGGFEVWVDTSSNVIEHLAMSAIKDGGVTFTSLPSITVPEPPAGLAVDDRNGRLYVSQRTLGVLTVDRGGAPSFLISVDAGHLGLDVGGIDLFLEADGGVLVFTAAPTEVELKVHSVAGALATYRATLQIGMTDGGPQLGQPRHLDVYEQPVPGFPKGVLIVQDELAANYKLVSLAALDAVFPLPPPYLPGGAPPAIVDAGTDGGADAGTPDGGFTDAGAGVFTGHNPGPAPGVDPTPSCGCTGGPFTVLPALLLLWWIRRRSP